MVVRLGRLLLLCVMLVAACAPKLSTLEELDARCAQGDQGACVQSEETRERNRRANEALIAPENRPQTYGKPYFPGLCRQGFEGEIYCD